MKRRFEFVEGTSNKFWEVSVSNSQVSVTFGRIGTAGQRHNKSFTNPSAAQQHADKLIQQKLAKGYVELAAA